MTRTGVSVGWPSPGVSLESGTVGDETGGVALSIAGAVLVGANVLVGIGVCVAIRVGAGVHVAGNTLFGVGVAVGNSASTGIVGGG